MIKIQFFGVGQTGFSQHCKKQQQMNKQTKKKKDILARENILNTGKFIMYFLL